MSGLVKDIQCHIQHHTVQLAYYQFADCKWAILTLKVLVVTIDAQCEGMGDVGSVRYEPVLLPPCPSIRVLSYSNCQRSTHSMSK